MTYILLMVMIIIFLFLFYKKFDNDILSPTVISFLMYLFGIILAAIGLFYWNDVYKLSYKTILIIFSGLIFFALGEFVSRKKEIHQLNEKWNLKQLR